jgi:hypothetical protein
MPHRKPCRRDGILGPKGQLQVQRILRGGINDLWRAFAYDIRERVKKGEDVTKDLNGFFVQMVDQVLTMNK